MGKTAPMLFAHWRRNDQLGQFLTNRFLTGKTKGALGSRVKLEDAAICAHGDDAIQRVIEDAAIQHFELFAEDMLGLSQPGIGFHLERAVAAPFRSRNEQVPSREPNGAAARMVAERLIAAARRFFVKDCAHSFLVKAKAKAVFLRKLRDLGLAFGIVKRPKTAQVSLVHGTV